MSTKTSPGIVKMKCLIWEPKPIVERPEQDQSFNFNSVTLNTYPEAIRDKINIFPLDPSSFYLREKYVYRDTFLKIGDETLNSDRADMFDILSNKLFDEKTGLPNYPEITHQTFILNGSLFSPNIATPSFIKNEKIDVLDNGLSKWTYEWTQTTDEEIFGNNRFNKALEIAKKNNDKAIENYAIWRKTRRLMPVQTQVSTERKISNGTIGTADIKPIHWLCLKETPLFRGEDFFVEFHRKAYDSDTVSIQQPMLSKYATIDCRGGASKNPLAKLEPVCQSKDEGAFFQPPGDIQQFPINNGVLFLNEKGEFDSDGSSSYVDLSNQPYYAIEIGVNDKDDNYWIIIPYNGKPMFLQTGKFPIIGLSKYTSKNGKDQKVTDVPFLCSPNANISRRLSTYDIGGQSLMDQDVLRLTVRNHFGRIVITFNGHEDNPWVINRQDYVVDESNNSGFSTKFTPMIVPAAPIQIAGGNLKAGFLFAPLHYQTYVNFTLPQYLKLNGPVDETLLSLFLREKTDSFARGGSQKTTTNKSPQYFQEAEVYIEQIEGLINYTTKKSTLKDNSNSIKLKAPDKDTNISDFDALTNLEGDSISYISIAQVGPLIDPTENEKDAKIKKYSKYLRLFNANFALGSGDYTFPEFTDAKGNKIKTWSLFSCITPIATGWRLFVPKNDNVAQVDEIDVSHHVKSFSANYSYTDNTKVEHSGNISFLINIGQQTGAQTSVSETGSTNSATTPPTGTVDYSQYLASLNDKTFFIRIYAWWEGGYMECGPNCPTCCNCKNTKDTSQDRKMADRVLFTGLCHGGDITVRGTERHMDCQLLDYNKILQDTMFLNSPFYDGMRDFNACFDVLKIAGFADTASSSSKVDKWPPLSIIKTLADSNSPSPTVKNSDGNIVTIPEFGLPSSFSILQSPLLKFSDGSSLQDAISKFAQFSGKVHYFDRFGIFRYEQRSDIIWQSMPTKLRKAKCNFYASIKDLALDSPNTKCKMYDAIALNQYSYKRGASDVINEIHIFSTTPEGFPLFGGAVNYESKFNPDAPGYVGYSKRLYQADGIFGNESAVRKAVEYYKGFFIPPIIINWESMGIARLQAMDIVSFTGLKLDGSFPPNNNPTDEDQPENTVYLVITSLSTEINPEKNEWTNRYEAEWIFSGDLQNVDQNNTGG